MITIYELVKIETTSNERYPKRKTETLHMGLFSSIKKAEEAMEGDVKMCRKAEEEYWKDLKEGNLFIEEEEKYGHEIVLAYRITTRELDAPDFVNVQGVRTYNADGMLNDSSLFDYRCRRRFKGRKPDQIRFAPGDIVEAIFGTEAELCVVWSAQPTVADYRQKYQRSLEVHRKECLEKGAEFKESDCPFRWDYSDDSYVVYFLGEGDTHWHPASPDVFRPTMPVPEEIEKQLREKFDEMCRLYGEDPRQKGESQEVDVEPLSESGSEEDEKKDKPVFHHFVTMPKYRGYHLVEDDNTHLYGIVKWGSDDFEMLLPCVINTFTQPCNEVIYFTSGTRQGLWHLHYGVIVPPVYDDIEFVDLGEPILFTKDGVKGYVDFDNNFVPKTDVDAIEDADERHDRLLEFLCEDSDY